jgi:hypothetical protein
MQKRALKNEKCGVSALKIQLKHAIILIIVLFFVGGGGKQRTMSFQR